MFPFSRREGQEKGYEKSEMLCLSVEGTLCSSMSKQEERQEGGRGFCISDNNFPRNLRSSL